MSSSGICRHDSAAAVDGAKRVLSTTAPTTKQVMVTTADDTADGGPSLECSSTRTSSAASLVSMDDAATQSNPAASINDKPANGGGSVMMKSVSKMRRRAKATAKATAVAAATPGRKLFSSLGSMAMPLAFDRAQHGDAAAARDADYRGPGAPFSPHGFVGVDEEWHEHRTGGSGGWSGDEIGRANADVATPTSLTSSTSSTRTPDNARARSLAIGSVTPVPLAPVQSSNRTPSHAQNAKRAMTRSITCTKSARSSKAAPSTGLTRYFTPKEHGDNSPLPAGGGSTSKSAGFGGSVALAIEAEAEGNAAERVSSTGRSSRSLRWKRGKTGGRSEHHSSPGSNDSSGMDHSYNYEDEDSQSVSTVVSARSIGGGSYDVAVATPGRALEGQVKADNDRPAPQDGAFHAKYDSKNSNDDEQQEGPEDSFAAVSVREVHVTPTSPLGNVITLTGRTVPMSNVKARPPRIEEEKEEEEWNGTCNDESEGLGVSPIAIRYDDDNNDNNNGDGGVSISSSLLSPPQLTRSILRRTPHSAVVLHAEGAASSPDSTLGSDFHLSVDVSSAATGTPSSTSSPPMKTEYGVTYSPSVVLPQTPPPVYSPLVSPTVAANLAYAKSMARLQLNSHMDDLRSGKRKVTRPLRPDLLEDDFDEYFDNICPPSLYVRVDSRTDVPDDADGLTWNTSLSNVRIDLADYDDPPPAPLCAEAGDKAASTGKRRSSRKSSPQLSPSSENRRKVMQAKADMQRKREYVKAKFKLREDMAAAQLVGTHGFSTGLARNIYRSTIHKLPLRVWIVDNSGSMRTGDGRLFIDGSKVSPHHHGQHGKKSGQVSQIIASSRWEELKTCVAFHAEMAASIGAPTIFRLLNDPNVFIREELRKAGEDLSQIGPMPQVVGVCARKHDGGVPSSSRLRNMLRLSTDTPHDGAGDDEGKGAQQQRWEGVWHLDTGATDDTDLEWRDRAEKDLELVENVLYECVPRYTTPLAGHIWALYDQVSALCSSLLPGQRVAIIIASDGVPTNPQSFLDAVQALQSLPVYLIVRLCTNDEASMHFWNTLDLDLQIPVEVLDDFEEESRIAYAMNPWCNCCIAVQRAREWGFRSKLFEKLRERPLTHSELHNYCCLIFGVKKDALADPEEAWDNFYYDVEALNARERRQYNPLTKRNRGWIDLKQMGKMYGGKSEISRRKKVLEARKENEKMRLERQRILELRKKAKKKAEKQKKTLGRASLPNRQHDPQSIGLGEC